LAARQNHAFQTYQKQFAAGWPQAHVEEIFADVFAAYTAGPALACSAILLQFAPADPYRRTWTHPSHDQRTAVIIQVLDHLQLAGGPPLLKASRDPARILENSWRQAAASAGEIGKEAEAHRQQACEWGQVCLDFVEQSWLHHCYTGDRWASAGALAGDLLKLATTDLEKLRPLPDKHHLSRDNLNDVLNGLWRARLEAAQAGAFTPTLNVNAYQLARLVQNR
jgi:hypothetical protein